MINTNYKNACAETLFIIKCLPHKDQEKIPKDFFEFLENNKNNNYNISINPDISLHNQPLLKETKELLKHVYVSFFVSENNKTRLKNKERNIKIIEEDIKKKNFTYTDLFDKKAELTNIAPQPIQEEKESFIKHILNIIKRLFNKKTK